MERIVWIIRYGVQSFTNNDRKAKRCIVDKLLLARFGREVLHTRLVIQNPGGPPQEILLIAHPKNLSRLYNVSKSSSNFRLGTEDAFNYGLPFVYFGIHLSALLLGDLNSLDPVFPRVRLDIVGGRNIVNIDSQEGEILFLKK